MSTENTGFDSQVDLGDVEVKKANPLKSWFPVIVMAVSLAIAFVVFYTVFGAGSNFVDGDNANDPLPGNLMGMVFKGGPVIPVGLSMTIMTLVFSIERVITLGKASGKGSIDVFVQKIRLHLSDNDIQGAIDLCDTQAGSVANVLKSGLKKYEEVESIPDLDKDSKKLMIQQELEEATNLELPMLERNLPILATIVAVGVLIGLFGTVLGMIKAFSALSAEGAPDASELATGISEALVNTAVGIFNSGIAIILYNYFTSRIDGLTYRIDEGGYSIIQTYDLKTK